LCNLRIELKQVGVREEVVHMRIVVVGAGIVGAACARGLASAGFDVTVLERGAVAGGTSSSCEGNLLVSDKTPGPELDLAVLASTRWPQVAAELHDQLGDTFPSIEYEPKGGLVVACSAAAADALLAFADTQRRQAGVEAYATTPREALRLEPHLNPRIAAAVHYPGDAQVQPTVAVEALLASARMAGACVRTHERVVGATRDATGSRIVGVRTDRGHYPADVVVNAAGPWAGEVAALLGAPVPVLPRFGMVLVTPRMPHRVFHKVYDADYVGATQSGDADLQTSAVVESTAAGTVLIGSSRQRVGFDDRLTVPVISEIAAKAIALFPFLEHTLVMRTYGGFRPYMPDHLPVIGPDHRVPGLYHVTGHEGAGIGLSVVSADILLAQLSQTTAPLDPAPFALDRASLAPHLKEAA
jgi:glycine/D-amino acid oxidase-like deaminating enzyme